LYKLKLQETHHVTLIMLF